MKFDFVIGNPPYQEENDNSVRKAPIYNYFMDEAYKISDVVELITPCRFLFNAGQTPKVWNKKMLEDNHFKVLHYEKDATKIFSNTDIKGGIAISIRNSRKDYGRINVFTPFEELNSIYKKIKEQTSQNYMDSIVSQRGMFRLTESFFDDFPDASSRLGAGTGNMIVSNIFEKIPEAFLSEDKIENQKSYIKILGRVSNSRVYRYIEKKYVIENSFLNKYKLFFPEANSSGKFGETLTLPEIGLAGEGSTDTFINIGLFDEIDEAINLIKYIKTKFLRALLGIKKATQHSPKSVWDTIPIQNFSNNSDIDWSKTISEIDKALYEKYNFSDLEKDFIENNVKEMA